MESERSLYKQVISPVLDRLDSEKMHVAAREGFHLAEMTPAGLWVLEKLCVYRHERFIDERLKVVVGGVEFENPTMVGPGWDKIAHALGALHRLGFSGTEVGSVLEYPQPGNDKPRQETVTHGNALVARNALGFNSPGMEVVAENLEWYKRRNISTGIIGISLGKNKNAQDAPKAHAVVTERLYKYASYFTINVSSPNTPGLRELQDKGPLTEIVQAVNSAMDKMGGRKPLFVKIAPDLTNDAVNDVIRVVMDNGLTGIVATNTTNNPELKAKYGWGDKPGGLSGDDPKFRKMATEKVAHIYRETNGAIEVIGVGGVKDTETALEKIRSGAKVIQIVTGIRGEGPGLPGRINRGLVTYLDRENIPTITELVGADVR